MPPSVEPGSRCGRGMRHKNRGRKLIYSKGRRDAASVSPFARMPETLLYARQSRGLP